MTFEKSISDFMTCNEDCTLCTFDPTLEVRRITEDDYTKVESTVIEVTITDDKVQFEVKDIDGANTACITRGPCWLKLQDSSW